MKAKYIKRIPKPGGGFKYVYGAAKGESKKPKEKDGPWWTPKLSEEKKRQIAQAYREGKVTTSREVKEKSMKKSDGGIDMSHYDGLAILEKARGRMDQSNMFKLLGVLPAGTVAETNSQSIIALDRALASRGMRTQGDEEIQAIRENK